MKIRVMSKLKAVEHSIKTDINKCIIVSINTPNYGTYLYDNKNIIDILPLYFNDIERDYKNCLAPRQNDFAGLKDFIDTYKDQVDEIIVHCAAGISRSSATAAAICQYLKIDEVKTIWANSDYIPNTLVYKLALKELGLKYCEHQISNYIDINKMERDKNKVSDDILFL